MELDRFFHDDEGKARPAARISAAALLAAFAAAACTPDRSQEVDRLQRELAACRGELTKVGAAQKPDKGAQAPAVVAEGEPPSHGQVQGALDEVFGTDLATIGLRATVASILHKLATEGVSSDLFQAISALFGWDERPGKRAALLALAGNDGNRLVGMAGKFVEVVKLLPADMQTKLVAEMTGYVGTFDFAFVNYPKYKGMMAHHGLWLGAPENGYQDRCQGAIHNQYEKLSDSTRTVMRMLRALEGQGMALAKVKEAVQAVRTGFGL